MNKNEEDEAGDEYIVEEIVGVKYDRANKVFIYHIKWQDYDSSENTWEPEEHLSHCPLILGKFKSSQKFADYVDKLEKHGVQVSEKDKAIPILPPALAIQIPTINDIECSESTSESNRFGLLDDPNDYPRVVGTYTDMDDNLMYLVRLVPGAKSKRINHIEARTKYTYELLRYLERRLVDKDSCKPYDS